MHVAHHSTATALLLVPNITLSNPLSSLFSHPTYLSTPATPKHWFNLTTNLPALYSLKRKWNRNLLFFSQPILYSLTRLLIYTKSLLHSLAFSFAP
jgi:hypothetical protein